jgi:hypothetical protein
MTLQKLFKRREAPVIFNIITKHGRNTGFSGEPDKFSGEPDKFSGEPDKFSGEPDKFSGEPDKFPGEPEKFPGEPEKLSCPRINHCVIMIYRRFAPLLRVFGGTSSPKPPTSATCAAPLTPSKRDEAPLRGCD